MCLHSLHDFSFPWELSGKMWIGRQRGEAKQDVKENMGGLGCSAKARTWKSGRGQIFLSWLLLVITRAPSVWQHNGWIYLQCSARLPSQESTSLHWNKMNGVFPCHWTNQRKNLRAALARSLFLVNKYRLTMTLLHRSNWLWVIEEVLQSQKYRQRDLFAGLIFISNITQ